MNELHNTAGHILYYSSTEEGSEMSSDDLVSKFHNHITLAEVYHVYHSIHRFIVSSLMHDIYINYFLFAIESTVHIAVG